MAPLSNSHSVSSVTPAGSVRSTPGVGGLGPKRRYEGDHDRPDEDNPQGKRKDPQTEEKKPDPSKESLGQSSNSLVYGHNREIAQKVESPPGGRLDMEA